MPVKSPIFHKGFFWTHTENEIVTFLKIGKSEIHFATSFLICHGKQSQFHRQKPLRKMGFSTGISYDMYALLYTLHMKFRKMIYNQFNSGIITSRKLGYQYLVWMKFFHMGSNTVFSRKFCTAKIALKIFQTGVGHYVLS